ncbi:hypothetical protein JG688_00012265, partial [Phytophthora aleatoria]
GLFKASWSWRKPFLRRHKLSIRRRTREGQSTPANAEQKTETLTKQVRLEMQELGLSVVYNADQTGVNYEYVPTTTIPTHGVKTGWVKFAGKRKERVAAMLLAVSDGTKREAFSFSRLAHQPSPILRKVMRHGFGRRL